MSVDGSHPFEPLFALQDEDLRIDQLRARIAHHPANDEIRALHDRSVALDRSSADARLDHEQLSARQSAIEVEVAEIDRRLSQIDERLSSGATASFRDQSAMSDEMGSLAQRKRLLEDEELELMERLEPLEAELSSVGAAQAELQQQARTIHAQMHRDLEELSAELEHLGQRRAEIASTLPAALVDEYDRIRARQSGVGVARLVHGRCSGCNLTLPATELDQIRRAVGDQLFHCDQCGRILVP